MAIYSCMGCESRYPGCHSVCHKYIEEKAKHDAENAEIRKKRMIECELFLMREEKVRKAMKNRWKGRKYVSR